MKSKTKVLVCSCADYKIDNFFNIILTGNLSTLFHEVGDFITTFGYFEKSTSTLLVRPAQSKPKSFFDVKLVIVSPNIKIKVTGLTSKSECMRSNILRSLYTPVADFSEAGLKGTI